MREHARDRRADAAEPAQREPFESWTVSPPKPKKQRSEEGSEPDPD